ncbi:ClC family H(+)/Cl(-) exchange transporter [Blautia argi]|uniref:ClC family H(+)/Cl(-) exchange transporter n=1 Tax=Blautia argi TaxID=1912897 RepID=UPI00280BE413|nr:ClC family H(+)/Cl(-) exchange transporter [Blautia argi]
MKKGTSHLLKRAEHFKTILTAEGFVVGIAAGLVVLLYRVLLEYAGRGMELVLEYARRYPALAGTWFFVLFAIACIVGKLVKYEPMISGSGIPQVEGEMMGKLDQVWWKVLPAKFLGGFLSLFSGLSLGREGPSIQIGAMVGKAVSKALKREKTEERYLLTCGASAGLAAAFHAPLAGVMFSLEEIHKNFSVSVLVSVMTASITADYISSEFLGFTSVFQFDIGTEIAPQYYGHIVILGILLGIMGAFYNKMTMWVQGLYFKAKGLNETTRLLIPFLLAGVLGLVMPQVLGSGHELIDMAAQGNMVLKALAVLFLVKFLFSLICFGSGAPGGIFFPLLVLGALLGGMYSTFAAEYMGLDPSYISNFVLLAMAGYFTAIVRAPITGIILIFEMTGQVSQMLSMSLVSIVAYLVASGLKSEPIYESLLGSLLRRRGQQVPEKTGGKILQEFVICHGSLLHNQSIQQVSWAGECLLVAVKRNGTELIPKGKTILRAGDVLVTLTDEDHASMVYDSMKKMCAEKGSLS